MPEVLFNQEAHEYSVGGRVLPSVTQVLKAFGLISGDYAQMDPFYAERGTAVHAACEFHDKGTLDAEALDPQIVPYLDAWKRFRDEARPVIHGIEKRFAHRAYAGTVDRILSLPGTPIGVLDIKTGKPAAWHSVQTFAYAAGGLDGIGSTSRDVPRWALYLDGEGRYKLERHQDYGSDALVWGGMLSILEWKRRHGIDWRNA